MKSWIVKIFGKEIFRIEEQVSVPVNITVLRRDSDDDAISTIPEDVLKTLIDGMTPCECCGEMFDPESGDTETDIRFADIADRLMWGQPADEPDEDD